MGPEYIAIGLTTFVSAITGGSWAANKILGRSYSRISQLSEDIVNQEKRVNSLQEQLNRLPIEYVLKVDFLREIQEMQDNFRQINNKLDKLMEKLFER